MVQHPRQLGSVFQHRQHPGGGRQRGPRHRFHARRPPRRRRADRQGTQEERPARLALRQQNRRLAGREIRQILCRDRTARQFQQNADRIGDRHHETSAHHILRQRKTEPHRAEDHRHRRQHDRRADQLDLRDRGLGRRGEAGQKGGVLRGADRRRRAERSHRRPQRHHRPSERGDRRHGHHAGVAEIRAKRHPTGTQGQQTGILRAEHRIEHGEHHGRTGQ